MLLFVATEFLHDCFLFYEFQVNLLKINYIFCRFRTIFYVDIRYTHVDMEGVCDPVLLRPFLHQVGGHSLMVLFNDTTICKPLIKREVKFYETLTNALQHVTPEYRGNNSFYYCFHSL